MNLKYTVAAIAGGAIVAWLVLASLTSTPSHEIENTPTGQIQTTGGVKHSIPLNQIKSGGPPKDGIPSIDSPKFVSDAEFVSDDDVVIGLKINGQARAYPLFILVWHEIVNDKIGDVPVAVTYCPLCYTSQVFDRRINGAETEFGTSGKLYNSNLVMYDRNTDSMWSQALGEAVVGELTGYKLQKIPFDLSKWSDWKRLNPDTVVLSTDTGHLRSYGVDPYGSYYTNSDVIFPVSNTDDRMHPKEIILGFDHDKSFKAYKIADAEKEKIINDSVDTQEIVLVSVAPSLVRAFDRNINGQILEFVLDNHSMIDKQTNSMWTLDGLAISGPLQGTHLERIPSSLGFWFEWVAFHPDTEVYQRN